MSCPSCNNVTVVPAGSVAAASTMPETVVIPAGEAPRCTRVIYVLLGIFLGSLGIHNFAAGYTKKAVIQLILTLLIITSPITFIWWIVDLVTVKHDADGVPM